MQHSYSKHVIPKKNPSIFFFFNAKKTAIEAENYKDNTTSRNRKQKKEEKKETIRNNSTIKCSIEKLATLTKVMQQSIIKKVKNKREKVYQF